MKRISGWFMCYPFKTVQCVLMGMCAHPFLAMHIRHCVTLAFSLLHQYALSSEGQRLLANLYTL